MKGKEGWQKSAWPEVSWDQRSHAGFFLAKSFTGFKSLMGSLRYLFATLRVKRGLGLGDGELGLGSTPYQ